jgi:hypothetical protein
MYFPGQGVDSARAIKVLLATARCEGATRQKMPSHKVLKRCPPVLHDGEKEGR